MSKIDNPTIKKNEQPLPEETAFHVEHQGEPTSKTSQSAPEIESANLLSRSVDVTMKPSTDSLCTKAHALRANGEIAKAYLAYKEAADQGSIEAKFWLGEVDRPFAKETPAEAITHKPTIEFMKKFNVNQNIILQKFSQILDRLHELNPEEYDLETINAIKHELKKGHCSGFALYFIQLALTKNPGSSFDRTEELAIILQKICDWNGELFEPPEGFSYESDFEKLTDDEKKNLAFTNELKEFISIIRFGQHTYHEEIEDEKAQSPRLVLEGASLFRIRKFDPNIDLLHLFHGSSGQFNFDFILGDKYQTKMKLNQINPRFGIDAFIKTLKSYLTETNAAHIALDAKEMHAISIIYREGKYYLHDSNSPSQEENFDPRYSARSYDTLEELNQDIKSLYTDPSPDLIQSVRDNISYSVNPHSIAYMTIIERKGSENFYLSDQEEYERLDMIKLNELSKRLPDDQFNQLLHLSMETGPYDLDLQSMDEQLYLLFPAQFFKNAKAILLNDKYLKRENLRSLIDAAPSAEHKGLRDHTRNAAQALNDLGNLYATPYSLLYNPEKAFHFFQSSVEKDGYSALYNLATCYHIGFGTEKNEDLAITYFLKAADNENKDAINVIGYLFNEQKQILNNPHFMDYLLQAAYNGVVNASYHVGKIYMHGLFGQEQNTKEALLYLDSPELSNDPEALYMLSELHLMKNDTDFNDLNQFRAIRALQKAADLGHPLAQLSYGHELINSNTENDADTLKEALYYFQLAADQGNPEAQFYYGAHLYNHPDFLDYREDSLYYLKLSAAQGNEEAIIFLTKIGIDE